MPYKKRITRRKGSSKYDQIAKAKQAASLRRKIKAFLGNECFVCGYKVSLKALELHHVSKPKKKFNISMNVLRYKWATLVKEIVKCILVCNRCHVEIEEGLVEVSEKDIPKSYYKKILDSLKPAKKRFKSKSYARQRKGATSAAKSRRNNKRTRKNKS